MTLNFINNSNNTLTYYLGFVLRLDDSINIAQTHVWGKPKQAPYENLMLVLLVKTVIEFKNPQTTAMYLNIKDHRGL